MTKKCFVICNNDSIEYVIIGTEEQANRQKHILREKHYKDYQKNSANLYMIKIRRLYDDIYFWHIHEVEYEVKHTF